MPLEITQADEFAVTERGKKITHTNGEVRRALELNALCGGQSKRAAEMLADEGYDIGYDKLRSWVKQQFEYEYIRVRKEVAQSFAGEKVAGDAMEIAEMYGDAERQLVDKLIDKLDQIPADKIGPTIQNLAMSKDRNVIVSQLLRGQPTEIVEERDVSEIFRELKNLRVSVPADLDLDAEEVD